MKGLNILILEDDDVRMKQFYRKFIGNNVVHTERADECIHFLKKGRFDVLFLDHDLGGKVMVSSGSGTGYEVAEWLEKHPKRQPDQIFVHSYNPVGAKNICDALPSAKRWPSAWLEEA